MSYGRFDFSVVPRVPPEWFAASAAYYSLGKGTEEIESVDGHWTDSVYFGKPGPSLESYLAGEGKSIWNSYSPGLVTYKGVDPYPRQVVGRGSWRYGRTIVQLYDRRISGIGTWVPEVPENVSNRCTFMLYSIVLHFGAEARPFRDTPIYSKGRSTSVAGRGRLA